jgi:hypothetical protein
MQFILISCVGFQVLNLLIVGLGDFIVKRNGRRSPVDKKILQKVTAFQ